MSTRRRLTTFVATFVAAAGFTVPAQAAVSVWFFDGPSPTSVERDVRGVRASLAALLAGPTSAERGAGLRTAIPAGPLQGRVRSIRVHRRLVTIDLAAPVLAARDPGLARRRLEQLVRTLDGIPGVRGVRFLVEGGTPLGLVDGVDLERPLTAGTFRPAPGPTLRQLQQRLADLGYMEQVGVSGVADEQTVVATTAFQKWAGLPRDGRLEGDTVSRLLLARRPEPVRPRAGRRVEVLLDRQVALLEENGKVLRVVHVSTGASGYGTPVGSFRVYRKESMSWSVPFSVWMPWASYFYGGIALHQGSSVPIYPASHGCVRVNRFDSKLVFEFAVHGTPVEVLWTARP